MHTKHLITVAKGDGIGPEIMEATLHILEESGAHIEIETIEIGEKVYLSGNPNGIEDKTWESLRRSKVFLKAPITTPQGGGYRSLNVTVRGRLGLYSNIRPCVSYSPFIKTKHPIMDVVIIRENEEDLYTGIEYQQTPDVCQALKIISRPGSTKIVRSAFEYARHYGRKKVTCFTKDNILKLSDGLFHQVFDEIGAEYPDIEKEHWIIDIGSAKLADTPEAFDVLVLPNLYGDILSDVAAQITGSVGLAGSANIGEHGAMFEAIHGSAPRRAGQDVANPSGLILASIMMMVHIHQPEVATRIHNAWLKTIEEGIHTYDIYSEGVSKKCVGTKEFARSVASRLGKQPEVLKSVSYGKAPIQTHTFSSNQKSYKRDLVGVDIYLYSKEAIDESVNLIDHPFLKLKAITNRGVRVWPDKIPETFCIDHWRCRFVSKEPVEFKDILDLLQNIDKEKFDIIKIENLYYINGNSAYSDI